jgi:hypothetical protein
MRMRLATGAPRVIYTYIYVYTYKYLYIHVYVCVHIYSIILYTKADTDADTQTFEEGRRVIGGQRDRDLVELDVPLAPRQRQPSLSPYVRHSIRQHTSAYVSVLVTARIKKCGD